MHMETNNSIETVQPLNSEAIDWRNIFTKLLYGFIGLVSSLTLFLAFYRILRIDSSITSVFENTYGTPFYFWPYVLLTVGTIILFGVGIALLVYRVRKFGFNLRSFSKGGSFGGLGSIVGIAGSACPVCGSTLLSAVGLVGGVAVLPLAGLELKALSFGLMALPVWLVTKDIKKLEADCGSGVCPAPKDHSFKKADWPWLAGLTMVALILTAFSLDMLQAEPVIARALYKNNGTVSEAGSQLFNEVAAKVLPEQGFQSKIVLSNSIVKLAQNGVIDREKFLAIYESRGDLPPELANVLDTPSEKPILLTRENASYYVNLLWPLGLANYMESNKESPVNGKSLFNFASTGGWTLGKEENGGAYFNKFDIVELTPEQEALVTKVAQNTYRPCCNNSTFFQDCNHGSALLGLLQLGVSQGLMEDELYREALAFNSFWFPNNYIQTALYFTAVENTDWENVDPKLVMSKEFSSVSGWSGNVAKKVQKLGLMPQQQGGSGCGV